MKQFRKALIGCLLVLVLSSVTACGSRDNDNANDKNNATENGNGTTNNGTTNNGTTNNGTTNLSLIHI